jgi:imidazolonepropionase-like amidohydrolase
MSKLFWLPLLAASAAVAQTLAVVNARIVPVSGQPIDKGTILIEKGRIAALGSRVAVPKNATRVDAAGLSVYPGWVLAFSTLGLSELTSVRATVDTTELAPFNPAAEAWVAVNPDSERLRLARSLGVTSALTAPRENRIAGTASVISLHGDHPAAMAILKSGGLVLQIPSLRGPAPDNMTAEARRKQHAGQMDELRRYFREAQAYSAMRERGGPANDSSMEAMLPFVRGERPVIALAGHFRDIRDAVSFADEFKLRLVIADGRDAWKVADLLKQKNVGVIHLGVQQLPLAAEDPYDAGFAGPQMLHRAGVRFALSTAYEGVYAGGDLPWLAATAMAFGLSSDDALKSITLWPAELLGVDKEVGSLDVGKRADLVLWEGDPFDIRSRIHRVYIGGVEVSTSSRHTQLYERFRKNGAETH